MKLVTINMIRDGVMQTLRSKYPDMNIYGEKIEQGFKEPCFFVKLLNGESTRELNRRFMRYQSFDVHYFPPQPYNRNAWDMAEELSSLFLTLVVDGETYLVTGVNYEIVEDVLHFFFDVNFMVWHPDNDDPKMRNLDQREWIK